THWGISGPAVLKLSAFGAILMKETGYKNRVIINWVNAKNEEEVRLKIKETIELKPRSLPLNTNIYSLAERLWKFLLFKSGVDITKNWSEQTAKSINRLVNIIFSDFYETEGKTTFKEEFVTCGGVDINEVNFESMESKLFKGLYFAGEVLNMDGITGGFNFQAAWSTAWLVANSITEKVNS
ncbi:MAG: NAD(P)/FAD-dependent oxidoreductase, partial [Bacteroidota bacterium]